MFADASLTVDNVTKVMEIVTADRIMGVWQGSDVLKSLVKMISGNLSTIKKTQACVNVYINCYPHPSWIGIISMLYNCEEMTAAREAKKFSPQDGKHSDIARHINSISV